ncbi:heme oxygenase-like protein [Tribonema minus]|uniref:Heme oxygenase-like protein n=1 Tax=Tribonema minus TaxID=303371 RepID=A0A835Z600_9STRA|nr:heme oxygenase-like protein [Tribonema minus]
MSKADPNSFVQGEMRGVAMKLHTRDQAPREGQQEETGKKFAEWAPTRAGYLQFLVDSRAVYSTFDEVVGANDALAALRDTGLERTAALEKDIAWMLETYPELATPPVSDNAAAYCAFLKDIAAKSVPGFVCHFYNHYFAHTAGGIMIGKKVADLCLGGQKLAFYQWASDVRALLDAVRVNIDAMADGWSREEKDECLDETARTFKYGGSLLGSITGA